MIRRLAFLGLLALAAVTTATAPEPLSGPAGTYTVITTGPTRITSGATWIRLDWDTAAGPVVTPPAPTPPTPAPAQHTGHFTLSYIEPKYPSPASGAVRDGLAKTDWTGLDTTYRSYTDGAKQLDTLGFTPLYKTTYLPMCFLQEDGPAGAAVIGTYKFPSTSADVVKWVTEFRGKCSAHYITTADGVQRVLGLVPSEIDNAGLLSAVPISRGQVIPESGLVEFDDWPDPLSVLNQGTWNACTYFTATQALMYGRYQGGQGHVDLDPMWLYLKVTGGRNIGTNLLQSSQHIARYGVPPVGTPKQAADKESLRFRFEFSEQFKSYEQILSSVARRRAVAASVCVGNSWNTLDAEGVPGRTAGIANHAIFLGGGLRKSPKHGWMVRHCGSWGTGWGQRGFAWFTEAHFQSSLMHEFYGVQGVTEDLSVDVPPKVAPIA